MTYFPTLKLLKIMPVKYLRLYSWITLYRACINGVENKKYIMLKLPGPMLWIQDKVVLIYIVIIIYSSYIMYNWKIVSETHILGILS